MLDFRFKDTWASSFDIQVLDILYDILPANRDHYETIPGRHGSYLFEQPWGDRTITIECAIKGTDFADIRDKIHDIAAWLVSFDREELQLGDTPGKYYMAKLTNAGTLERDIQAGFFTLEFTCEPFAYSLYESTSTYTIASGGTESLYYLGTYETEPIIQITATSGEITNPSITINDLSFTYNFIIPNNSTLTVDCRNYTVFMSSTNVITNFSGDFPVLEPGNNSIRYSSANGATAQIKIIYRERWL